MASILPNLKHITIGNEKLKNVTLSNIGQQDNDELIEGSALVFKKSINLEEIEIKDNAFQHFENFTLGENPEENEENFPKLRSIKFGKSGRYDFSRSYMFSTTPFVLANLPSLEEVVMSGYTFYSTNTVVLDNLPKLKNIFFGSNAFFGSLSNAELTMLNVGTEYYTTELKKTQMTVRTNTFNSHFNVYLKDTPVALEFIPTSSSETETAFTSLQHIYYTFSGEWEALTREFAEGIVTVAKKDNSVIEPWVQP